MLLKTQRTCLIYWIKDSIELDFNPLFDKKFLKNGLDKSLSSPKFNPLSRGFDYPLQEEGIRNAYPCTDVKYKIILVKIQLYHFLYIPIQPQYNLILHIKRTQKLIKINNYPYRLTLGEK